MSKGKVGALIVIEKSVPLNDIIRTGEIINANVNQRLIFDISIFKENFKSMLTPSQLLVFSFKIDNL